MSVIEHPEVFRCVVSISGITDPGGNVELVRVQGSPFGRADEIEVPVMLVHAGYDEEAPLALVRSFAKRLERRDKDVTLVEYEDATGDFRPRRYRIDMLERVGDFVDAQLRP